MPEPARETEENDEEEDAEQYDTDTDFSQHEADSDEEDNLTFLRAVTARSGRMFRVVYRD